MTDLFTKDERENLTKALTEGLVLLPDTDIPGLTMMIWENIAGLPHAIESNFNIIGNSSILNVLNENKEPIMNIHINPEQLQFELAIPEYKFTQKDRVAAAFATMSTVDAWYKITNFV
jgi:hypothetical protein